jgi:hypothetical protein
LKIQKMPLTQHMYHVHVLYMSCIQHKVITEEAAPVTAPQRLIYAMSATSTLQHAL